MIADTVRVEGVHHPISCKRNCELVSCLDDRFSLLLRESKALAELTGTLDANGLRYSVFGGWVRDILSEALSGGRGIQPRDIDLVVDGIEIDELSSLFSRNVTPTIFGGIHSNAAPMPFDIWPLHETFLLKQENLNPSFCSLLRTTDFTINTACFFPAQSNQVPELLDGGMLQAISEQKLEFNASLLPFPLIQCARLAAYTVKLGLRLTPPVENFMREVLDRPVQLNAIVEGLTKTYCTDISIPAHELLIQLSRKS